VLGVALSFYPEPREGTYFVWGTLCCENTRTFSVSGSSLAEEELVAGYQTIFHRKRESIILRESTRNLGKRVD
jgi:hypothetical protein